jgi:hypothetical protein
MITVVMDDVITNEKSKKRNFDIAFKLKVVEVAENSSNRAAARKFSIDEANIRYWRKQKQQLKSAHGKKRLSGAGRKPRLPDMEEQLANWITELRSKNNRVTRANVQRKALELHQGAEEFCASRGWLEKFFK